jgi:hypothetical protein
VRQHMSLGPEGKAQCGCTCPRSNLIAVVGLIGHLNMRLVYVGGGSDLILAWFNVLGISCSGQTTNLTRSISYLIVQSLLSTMHERVKMGLYLRRLEACRRQITKILCRKIETNKRIKFVTSCPPAGSWVASFGGAIASLTKPEIAGRNPYRVYRVTRRPKILIRIGCVYAVSMNISRRKTGGNDT